MNEISGENNEMAEKRQWLAMRGTGAGSISRGESMRKSAKAKAKTGVEISAGIEERLAGWLAVYHLAETL